MLLRQAAALVSIFLVMGAAPLPTATDGSATVTINVDRVVGKATQTLAGSTWNTGDLALVSPLEPAYVRTTLRFADVSPSEGALELDDALSRIQSILDAGARPLILLSHMPTWLARPVPEGCRQERRNQAPCLPTAMGPQDPARWEQLVEQVVAHLTDHFDRPLTFELWNEPNIKKSWADSESAFVETVLAMHRAIARVEAATGHDITAGGVAVGTVSGLDMATAGPMVNQYLEAAVEQGTPPDFISWHDYTRDPLDYRRDAEALRELLGASTAPLVITEWNHYGRKGDERSTSVGAAFNVASLIEMERAGVSIATFYRSVSFGDKAGDSGLVTGKGTKRPSWWTHQLWRSLRGDRLRLAGDDPDNGLWARATRSGDQIDVLLASYAPDSDVTHTVALKLGRRCNASSATVRRIDSDSMDFRARQRTDLASLTVPAGGAVVWASIDCSGHNRATEIEFTKAEPTDEGTRQEAATVVSRSWLIWGTLAVAAVAVTAGLIGLRRRRSSRS